MDQNNQAIIESFINVFSVSFDNLVNLPCFVFRKDLNGTYLGYNDYGAKMLGYESGKAIIGKTAYDIFPHNIAENFQKNDASVINERKQIFVPEKGVLKNNLTVIFLSYKMPILINGQVVGILGIAFARPTHEVTYRETNNISIIELADAYNFCPQHVSPGCADLSKREVESLRYLSEGLTFKMIAKKMNVSPKTIETYIERAKVKMNCHNKTQLILSFIKSHG